MGERRVVCARRAAGAKLHLVRQPVAWLRLAAVSRREVWAEEELGGDGLAPHTISLFAARHPRRRARAERV